MKKGSKIPYKPRKYPIRKSDLIKYQLILITPCPFFNSSPGTTHSCAIL